MSEDSKNVKFHLSARQKQIIPLLMLGSFFEGFDFSTVSLALPFITREMSIDTKSASFMLSFIAVGTLLAFFIVRLGDKLGRKPIFMWAVVTYSILSLLTALTPSMQLFAACQFLARTFMVVSWATGFIIIIEEFESEMRGRALGLFQAAAGIGAIFPSLFMPLLAMLHLGWRGLYVLGALPLILVFFLAKNFHESERFQRIKESNEVRTGFFEVWKRPYVRYIIPICFIWILLYFCYSTGQNFLSYHAVTELGWNETQVGLATALAYTIGLLGYFTAGRLMDSIGRKPTAAIFLLSGSIFTICAFQAVQFLYVVLFLILAMFFVGVFTVIGASFTNELFPTAIRANATAWGNNIAGRIGQIAAPAIIGSIAVPLGGVGNAVSVLALAPIIALIIILLFLPETKNMELQDFVAPQDHIEA